MDAAREPRSAPLVLVVDDDRATRARLRTALEADGLAVAEAPDGVEGLAAFERLRPDLVLVDLHARDPDGFAVCRALRAREPGELPTPILVLAANGDPGPLEQAYAAGATDFVSGPLHAALLAHRVRYLLRGARTLDDLAESRRSLARVQRLAQLGSWDWNPSTGELRWSEQTRRILGIAADEPASWDAWWGAVHPADRERARAAAQEGMGDGRAFRVTHRVVHRDGGVRHVDVQGEVVADRPDAQGWFSGTIQDVSEQEQTQARIRFLASYDALTGLANRRLFSEQLERAIGAAQSSGHLVGVLVMDIDRFEEANEMLGHAAGDRLLLEVAERLRAHVRGSDTVGRVDAEEPAISRLGGDEFTVLLSKLENAEEAGEVARRILRAIPAPIRIDGHTISLTASVGIAIYPVDGQDVEALLKHADAALCAAKEQGRASYRFFSHRINASSLRRLALESRLREAIEREELRLHYQPRLDLRTGQVCAVEALLRWTHPELGVVSPRELVPLSEDAGLMGRVGEWVVRTACAQNRAWIEQGLAPVTVSVNVSPRQFHESDLRGVVGRALRDAGLDPRLLEVELTERLLLQDDETTALVLRDLRAMGVKVALDDFGSGYSSLSYLARFPLDTLKMDRCFVRDVDHDPASAGVARAVIAIGHTLAARVVAEGVETLEQERFLREAGCDELQGFLLAGALPPEQAARFLTARG